MNSILDDVSEISERNVAKVENDLFHPEKQELRFQNICTVDLRLPCSFPLSYVRPFILNFISQR